MICFRAGKSNVANDKSQGFDYKGTYDTVEAPEHLSYAMDHGQRVKVGKGERKTADII